MIGSIISQLLSSHTCSHSSYFHEEVRASAYESLGEMLVSAHRAWPPATAAVAVAASAGGAASLLSDEARGVLTQALPRLVEGLEDEDKHATSMAFQVWKGMGGVEGCGRCGKVWEVWMGLRIQLQCVVGVNGKVGVNGSSTHPPPSPLPPLPACRLSLQYCRTWAQG